MKIQSSFVSLACYAILPFVICSQLAAQDTKNELWQTLIQQIHETDFSKMPQRDAVRLLLNVSESCHSAERIELASQFLQEAIEIAESAPEGKFNWTLFSHALKIGQLEVAGEIAKESGSSSLDMSDRLSVARYENGDKDAIKDYPAAGLDFYNATGLANAFADAGEYEKLDEFVNGIKTLPSNEPTDVGTIVYNNIAKKYRDAGDMENAKKFIDKAIALGGNNYYTGFSTQVTKRSIYGELTKKVEAFAKRGAAYGSHMGRELVTRIVSELAETEHYNEAKKIVKFIDEQDDRDYAMWLIATKQARHIKFDAALQTVKQIKEKERAVRTKLEIASAMWSANQNDKAKQLVTSARDEMTSDAELQTDKNTGQLAKTYGVMRAEDEITKLIKQADSIKAKTLRRIRALEGVVAH